MHIRRILALAVLAALPKVAVAQFTTFIPPQTKVTDSVKAVIVAEQKAADSTSAARITNMKTWVDSAAGVLPVPTTTADSLASGIPATPVTDPVTMPNGTRAPATASPLALFAVAGLGLIVIGGVLIRGAPMAKRRA